MIGPMSSLGHIGHKVSALLDGQLSPVESERAWSHVHLCPPCRDLVEREGRLKQTLAQLGRPEHAAAPDSLKGALVSGIDAFDNSDGWPDLSDLKAARRPAAAQVTGWSILGVGTATVALVGLTGLGTPLAWIGPGQEPAGTTSPAANLTPVAKTSAGPTSSGPTSSGPSSVADFATTGLGRLEPARAVTDARLPTQQVRRGHHFFRAIR